MAELTTMLEKRRGLALAQESIKASMADIAGAGAEGSRYASYAAAWAAVFMTCDIVRTGWSAMDRSAAGMFSIFDKAIATANKILPKLGMKRIEGKADALAGLDPNLRRPAQLLQGVRSAKSALQQAKVKIPKELELLVDLAVGMSEDTMLILQAGQTQNQIGRSTASSLESSRRCLRRVSDRIRQLDAEIVEVVRRAERQARTA